MKKIEVKRVYDAYDKKDGVRILVDHMWPRNITKIKAHVDMWEKEITPSRELISWFHDDKENRFKKFEKKYNTYLKEKKDIIHNLKKENKNITLITAVKDIEHSHIPTLLHFFNT